MQLYKNEHISFHQPDATIIVTAKSDIGRKALYEYAIRSLADHMRDEYGTATVEELVQSLTKAP